VTRRWGSPRPTNAEIQGRKKAARVVPGPLPACECGRPSERHHKDGDCTNNDITNIELVCRSCHMKRDGRMTNLKRGGPVLPARPCRQCGKPYKPLRKGLCHACNERARRAAAANRLDPAAPDRQGRVGGRSPSTGSQ
jgi:hypothetical protein